MDKLLPCPFCGEAPKVEVINSYTWIFCANEPCLLSGPVRSKVDANGAKQPLLLASREPLHLLAGEPRPYLDRLVLDSAQVRLRSCTRHGEAQVMFCRAARLNEAAYFLVDGDVGRLEDATPAI